MKIVNIKKEFKPNVGPVENNVKPNDSLFGDSLNSLNNLNNNYDFVTNQISENVIKNEISIVNCCLNTFLKVIIKLGIIGLLVFLVVKYSGLNFDFFLIKDYTKSVFFDELKIVGLTLGILLLVVCLLIKFSINGTIKGIFKKKYLNKVGTYIYDVFIIILNIFSYVIVSFSYFMVLDIYYDRLIKWQEMNRVTDSVNVEILNWIKYVVVIVVAIFIAINSMKGMSIIHNRNKFVFEDSI